ncbi:major prion protein homolog [Rhinophrynus dorsalis]
MMLRRVWTTVILLSLVFVLTVVSKKGGGKSKTGGWNTGSNRNPSYPGSNRNPSYPGNTGTNWNPGNTGTNWGHNYNPGGGQNYNNKQWKPPKSKTNMKAVAGAAAVGAVGGFMLGNAIGNMRYHFNNDMEYQYYNRYQNQMPDRVYRPVYRDNEYVSEDRFVTDCYNMSVTEYIVKPTQGKNSSEVNSVETSVKTQIIREMCITEYRRGSGMMLFSNPWLVLSITLIIYFVVQ